METFGSIKGRMATPVRRIGSTIVIYGFGEFLVRAVSLITLPLFTRIFNPWEYGIVSLVVSVNLVVTTIAQGGSDTTIARYHARAGDLAEERTIAKTIMVAVGLFSVAAALFLTACVLFRYRGHDADITAPLLVSLASIPPAIQNRLLGQVLRNRFLSGLYAATNCLYAFVNIGATLALIFLLGLGITGIFAGILIAEAVTGGIRAFLLRDVWSGGFSRRLLPELIRFGAPLVPFSVCYWIYTSADRAIINYFHSTHDAGLFSTATSLASLMAMVLAVVNLAWGPYVMKLHVEDPASARRVIGQMTSAMVVLFGAITMGLCAIPDLLGLILGPEFRSATAIVPLLLLAGFVTAITQVVGSGLLVSGRTKQFAVHGAVAAAIHLAISLLLVPALSIVGAAIAAVVSQTYVMLALGRSSQAVEPVTYDVTGLALAGALVVAFVGWAYLEPAQAPLALRLVLATGASAMLALILAPDVLAGTSYERRLPAWAGLLRRRDPV
ncbi:MAG: oligosaccharide flippase family protein [Alsobacter sp.]